MVEGAAESIRDKVRWAGRTLALHYSTETSLPWRRHRTPYRIFLAELLLVRTRADVVTRLYENIYDRYPDIATLATADEVDVAETLRPLGMAKRVPYVIRAARHIRDVHGGEIPGDVAALMNVPGLGLYSAAAIATFAFGHGLVPADVNILRFVSRLTGMDMGHVTKGTPQLRESASLLAEGCTGLPAEKLLDFTRLVCRPRKARCEQCPLVSGCACFQISLSKGGTRCDDGAK